MKHSIIRIIIILIAFGLSIPLGYAMLDPNRRCGTGDVFAILAFMLLFYCIWTLWLLIETIVFHRKKEMRKRNQNLVFLAIFPVLIGLCYLYFGILNYFN